MVDFLNGSISCYFFSQVVLKYTGRMDEGESSIALQMCTTHI